MPSQSKTSPAHATTTEWDHAHVWHPFTPMRQWRETDPLSIASAEGFYLIDEDGNRERCDTHGACRQP